MDAYLSLTEAIALSLGVAWASGINLYAAVLVLGILGITGNVVLPEQLAVVAHPAVIVASGTMFCVEFFADKIPAVDSAWDSIHTFIRIPAGALLAAAAVVEIDPSIAVAAGLVGGTITAGTHAAKSGTRLVANTSPEPVSNWTLSLGEDLAVIAGIWAALNHPVLFLIFLALFVLLLAWMLPKLFRAIGRLFRWISGRSHAQPATS